MSRSKGWFMIIISLLFTLYFAYNAIAITYEYDDSNRMTVVTYDVGKYVYYYYDNNGNLLRTKMSWDIEPPKTGLIFPTNNSTLHGAGNVVVLSAYAESYRKMDWVEFYIDDALVGQSVYAPYKCNWLSTVGKHTVMTKAYDVKGDYGISDLITIKVPATISINNPLAGSELTGNVGNFSAVSSDPLLGWVALSIDGTAVDSVYLAEPASMVMFDYIWDTIQYLNGTSHEIKVSGSSEADDIYSQSKVNVTVYNPVSEIPVVRITSPANNSNMWPSGNTVTITANAFDNIGITKVEFYVNDEYVGESVYAPYSVNWLSTAGLHTVVAKAYDGDGNIGISNPVTVKVPAKIDITNPVSGSELTGTVGNFSAVSSDPLLGWVALSIDGTAVDSVYLAEPASMVMFDYIWDTTQYLNGTNHEIKVSGSSEADDIYSQSKVNVTVYNPVSEIPVVRITSPANNSNMWPSGNTVTITANAFDNIGITKVEFYVNDEYVGESVYAPYSVNWLSTVGLHTVVAKAYDGDGNIGISNPVTVKVPAKIDITNPVSGSELTGTVGNFSAVSSDPLLGWVALSIDGVAVDSINLLNPTSGIVFDYEWDTTQYLNGTSHEIKVSGSSEADDIYSQSKVNVTVYNPISEIPVVRITSPANNSNMWPSGNTVTITANAFDNIGITKVEFYVNDEYVGESVYAPYSVNWQSTAGLHTMVAKAYDEDGNIGISNPVTFKVPAQINLINLSSGIEVSGDINNFGVVSSDSLLGWVALSIDGTAVDSVYLAEPASMVMFDYIWDTTQYLNGVHEIKVSGSSEADDIYSQSKVNVTVYNPVSEIPVVRITSPVNNSTLSSSGNTVTITANGFDNIGITKVEFYVNDEYVGESVYAPYSVNWLSTVGLHTVVAKAYDGDGNIGISELLTVKIPAQIDITNPVSGSELTGTVGNFSAVSSDPLLGWVALSIDGVAVDSVNLTSPANSIAFDYVWDTAQYSNNSLHEIKVTGNTQTGSIYSQSKVNVTVYNELTVAAYPSAGIYNKVQIVALRSNKLANIYYTTDGSTPTVNSNRYVDFITISGDTTLKYIAIDSEQNSTQIQTENYYINPIDAPVKKALVYYSYPSLVNGATYGKPEKAIAEFGNFDYVVLGEALLDTNHNDHYNSIKIIKGLRDKGITVAGYIPICLTEPNYSIEKIKSMVDQWVNEMGANAIFLDTAGYDYLTTRARQNEIVDYVHSKGVSVCINSWNAEDILSDLDENGNYNPPHITANDSVLLESFVYVNGDLGSETFLNNKINVVNNFRKSVPIKVIALPTGYSPDVDPDTMSKYQLAYNRARQSGFEYFGWDDMNYHTTHSVNPFNDYEPPTVDLNLYGPTIRVSAQDVVSGVYEIKATVNGVVYNLSNNSTYSILPYGSELFLTVEDVEGNVYSYSTTTFWEGYTPIVDTVAPSVNITSPADNSTLNISGSSVTLTAIASDDVSVSSVKFFVDEMFVGEDINAPYSCEWTSAAGQHTVISKAYDSSGNIGVSNPITINVPAQIAWTSPVMNSNVSGVINSFTVVSDVQLIGWVALSIDGVSVASTNLTEPAYNVVINYPWDTRQYANGTIHELKISGHTSSGNIYSYKTITVTIDNPIVTDTTAPVISITSPSNNSTVATSGNTVSLKANASDDIGVTTVKFYVDDLYIGEDTTNPYSVNWQSVVGLHTVIAKAYDAAGNVGLSNSINVKVPTKITVTSPTANSNVSGTVYSFTANSQEPLLGWVVLSIDGVSVKSINLTTPSSTFTFNYVWDTNQYVNGTTREIKVSGNTASGNIYSSIKIYVTVNNST